MADNGGPVRRSELAAIRDTVRDLDVALRGIPGMSEGFIANTQNRLGAIPDQTRAIVREELQARRLAVIGSGWQMARAVIISVITAGLLLALHLANSNLP